ncbi:capsule biosynthesis protein CapD [Halobiforma lacisalsi AJ5]|uniref:Capsule biosynthesis protein CapD n=1 Tax=Natronobacterium lacisalsi AJ5 TaxID=358396 RepID=M0LNH6_NATLA|nr:SDR family NAD(P)-dependent oxidoreductase [Halobiforma lacisalsi]APW96770.1 capsule biosynthesis protein CapD [Halobiforma lacisalsi AJ5]EMA35041.1 polysaccharide biosynthesis protein CapD [Halobiforma lacisalsi AJ5]
MSSPIAGKNVLVTGGCGSIGAEIVSELLTRGPNLVRIVDNSEQRLASLGGSFGDAASAIDCVLANIRDEGQLAVAMHDVDIVFHAAAMKHVSVAEDNPYGAVRTNVTGTRNVVEAAADAEVDRLLGVSTDKAANPTSTMGSTKLIAERFISSFDEHRPPDELTLGSVRFGNVVGTKGSVVPLFYDQIRSGGPLTVTDPSMTRFVMRPEEAARFAIDACLEMDGGEVVVKKMPAMRVGDLAEAMRDHYAPRLGHDPGEVGIDHIGPKPGERYHEKLVAENEVRYADEREDRYVLYPQAETPDVSNDLEGEYTSANTRHMSRDEIIEMVRGTVGDADRDPSPDADVDPATATAASEAGDGSETETEAEPTDLETTAAEPASSGTGAGPRGGDE